MQFRRNCFEEKDKFGHDSCIKDTVVLKGVNENYELIGFNQSDDKIYLILGNQLKTSTVFVRYDAQNIKSKINYMIDWAFKQSQYFQTLSGTPDGKNLITTALGLGNATECILYVYDANSTSLNIARTFTA